MKTLLAWLKTRAKKLFQKKKTNKNFSRLMVEQLEDRTLLTLSINNLSLPARGYEGESVGFVAEASGGLGPLSYSWDFGDGTSQSAVDLRFVNHNYDANSAFGTIYTVSLTVSDGFTSISEIAEILINNLEPTTDAGPSQTVHQGTLVLFNGQGTDPGTGNDYLIEWDFDYRSEIFNIDASNTLSPSHIYNSPGLYAVALRITDLTGAASLSFTTVEVRPNSRMIVNGGADQNVTVGSPVSFSGTYSGGGTNVEFAWDFNYDGTFESGATGTLTPSHIFEGPGSYQVALKVTDLDNDCSKIDVLRVIAQYPAPWVEAGPDQTVEVGATVLFGGSFLHPGGTVSSTGIAWNFNWTGVFTPNVIGTLSPNYVYNTPGRYIVALQITDDLGVADIDFLEVLVNYVPLYVNAGPERTIAAGETTSFLGFYKMPGNVAPSGIEWDFDYDGISFTPDSSVTGNLTPTRQFNEPATYTVAIRVTDEGGLSQIATTTVNITNIRPAVSIISDLTITQGQIANFSINVSCPDPVAIEWDFHYEDGEFSPDPSAINQLNPSHQYLAAGIFLTAVRVTNSVGGASNFRTVLVNVTNVAPTAMVSNSGPTVEGTPITFTLSNVYDSNSLTSFTYEADWTGTGDFVFIPNSWLIFDPITGEVSFSHIYDDNGLYPVTIRVSDNEGGFTDYTQTVAITNAAPTVVLNPLGGDYFEIGPGVPIRFFVDDPSHADHIAGFRYFYSINDGPFVETTSGDFLLPTPPPNNYEPFHVRGYAVDKDNTGPIYERSIYVSPTSSMFFKNDGNGSVRLNWAGAIEPVFLGPFEFYNFQGVINGLTVTLLNSGASYYLVTNGSIETIDFETGVGSVNLSVDTGGSYLGPLIGEGRVGTIFLPGGSPAMGRTILNLYARGDLNAIVGPSGPGKLWTEANTLSFDDLNGSITGLDHIETIYARWLGDSPEDEVRARHGIDYLFSYGIRGIVTSDLCFDESPETYINGSTVVVGQGGGLGTLKLGRINYFSTAGSLNNLEIELLKGSVNLERGSSIETLNIFDALGLSEVRGEEANITTVILGARASGNPPVIQYFPLAVAQVISGYREDFWNAIDQDMKFLLRNFEYQVHHTRFQALKPVFDKKGINIDEVSSLRAVHPTIHSEITRRQMNWLDEQVKEFLNDQNASWNTHREPFLRRIVRKTGVNEDFWRRLTDFQGLMEKEYEHYWVKATDSKTRIRQVFRKVDGIGNIRGFQIGEGARARRLLPKLAGALAIFSIIESNLTAGTLLFTGHNQGQEEKFELFMNQYQRALNRALELKAPPEKIWYLIRLKDSLITYLQAIELDPELIGNLSYALEVYISDL